MPDDVKGMKIRPAHATMANFVTLLGGTNVQSSAPEVRDIIERGVADGVTFPWGSLVLFGVDKVTKYHMDAPLYVTTFVFVMNKDVYNQMSDRQKKAVDDNCNTEAAGRVGEPWGKFEDAGVDKVKAESGQEVYTLTADQLAQWKKASEPLVKTWADGVKKDRRRSGRGDDGFEGLARQIQRLDAVRGRSPVSTRRQDFPAAVFSGGNCWGRHAARIDGPFHRRDRMDRGRLCRHCRARYLRLRPAAQHAELLDPRFLRYRAPAARHPDLLGHCRDQLSRHPHHRRPGLGQCRPRAISASIDVFATLVLLFVVTVQTYTLFDKVRGTYSDNVLTFDMHMPTWPFFAVAWAGDVSAVLLIAIRTYRLIFHPEEMHDPKIKATE